jgi:DNA-directed RNA polymerase specialized sigma24 family protein
MADEARDFKTLMAGVAAGSEEAAQELLRVYGPHLMRAVRRRMHERLRAKFDSLDFAQDVWASFFARPPERDAFESPQKLIAFLAKVAQHKVIEAVRQRLRADKYNVNRELPLEECVEGEEGILAAQQPTPSEIVMDREAWDRLLEGQPPVFRRIFVLLREGRSPAAIAREMRISLKTVRLVIGKVLPRAAS